MGALSTAPIFGMKTNAGGYGTQMLEDWHLQEIQPTRSSCGTPTYCWLLLMINHPFLCHSVSGSAPHRKYQAFHRTIQNVIEKQTVVGIS